MLKIPMSVNFEKLVALSLYLCYYASVLFFRRGYVRSTLVPPSWDQQSAKHSSWPRNIIRMNNRTRTGYGSDHLAMLEDAMKTA